MTLTQAINMANALGLTVNRNVARKLMAKANAKAKRQAMKAMKEIGTVKGRTLTIDLRGKPSTPDSVSKLVTEARKTGKTVLVRVDWK